MSPYDIDRVSFPGGVVEVPATQSDGVGRCDAGGPPSGSRYRGASQFGCVLRYSVGESAPACSVMTIALSSLLRTMIRLFHERMKHGTSDQKREKRYEKAIGGGLENLVEDRFFADDAPYRLSQTKRANRPVGSDLFTYPLVGGSEAMMPVAAPR